MIREDLRLENQLCFRVHRLSRQFIGLYQPLLNRLGLTYPQYLVMLVLWEEDSMDYQELADRLDYSTGTLTPVIQRLEQAGLIQREKCSVDRRRTQVCLLPDGEALRSEVEAMADIINETRIVTGEKKLSQYGSAIDSLSKTIERFDSASKNKEKEGIH